MRTKVIHGIDAALQVANPLTDVTATITAVLPSVLVLDDDPDVAETLAAMVGSIGANARVSHTAADFFHAWIRSPADVAIIDLQMPGRDGLDVIHQLGAIGSAQVILSSGCDARILDAARHAASNNGLTVVGVLPKPVRRHALRKLLESVQIRNGTPARQVLPDPTSRIDIRALRKALLDRQIRPFFQPKVRLRDHKVHGFEALARWEHPELGLIQPDVFLPLIETHGLARQMTEVVISQAARFLSQMPDTGLTMAVNVSTHVCSEASFPDFLRMVIGQNDLSPARLILEITEAGPLEISQTQIDVLTRLRMQGFGLSIDDFGTGVSSLERLVRIPFNELKIDRYFAREISTSPGAEKLVRNLVRIATALEMTVTIEGIEDAETMLLSERLGCEFAQGFHIAAPMPGCMVRGWMAAFSKKH